MMHNRDKPETLEGDWDRFYWEFPDVYDRFAGGFVGTVSGISDIIDLNDKVVLDVGSGTGHSTFELAKRATLVIGIEPWAPMREFSIKKAEAMDVQNVAFVEGVAQALPLRARSVDHVVSVYGVPLLLDEQTRAGTLAEAFVTDATKAVRTGGYIVTVNDAPGWRREELRDIPLPTDEAQRIDNLLAKRFNFRYRDVYVRQEYDSLQEAIETYGFIYGRRAIDYLIEHNKTRFRRKIRIHYKQILERVPS